MNAEGAAPDAQPLVWGVFVEYVGPTDTATGLSEGDEGMVEHVEDDSVSVFWSVLQTTAEVNVRHLRRTALQFASTREVDQRRDGVGALLKAVLGPEDGQVMFVSDVSTLDAICAGTGSDTNLVLQRLAEHYGVPRNAADLNTPIWQLVDELARPAKP
jgi:hypothetical protein